MMMCNFISAILHPTPQVAVLEVSAGEVRPLPDIFSSDIWNPGFRTKRSILLQFCSDNANQTYMLTAKKIERKLSLVTKW